MHESFLPGIMKITGVRSFVGMMGIVGLISYCMGLPACIGTTPVLSPWGRRSVDAASCGGHFVICSVVGPNEHSEHSYSVASDPIRDATLKPWNFSCSC